MNRPLSVPITEEERRAFQRARRSGSVMRDHVIRLAASLPDTRTLELKERYNTALMESASRRARFEREKAWQAFMRRSRPAPPNVLQFGMKP